MSGSILVLGEALVDIVTTAAGQVSEHVGGSPANVALTLARLGDDVTLLTSTGDDERGERVRAHLTGNGITLLTDGATAPTTSTAAATLAADGQASYEFDLGFELPADVVAALSAPGGTSGYDCLHTGSIAAVLQPGGSQVLQIIDAGRESATISYDPNARPAIMGSPAAAREIVESFVRLADVVKLSDEDAAWLDPQGSPEGYVNHLLSLGPSFVIVTKGARGAYGACAAGSVDVPGATVSVADTVGAGDSFSGALIDALLRAGLLGAAHRDALRAISTEQLRQVMEFAVSVAAVTVSRPGADPPRRYELAEGPAAP